MTLGFTIRIEPPGSATAAAEKVKAFNDEALKEIREKAKERARKTVFQFKQEMDREYTSAWATGLLASGITFRTFVRGNGVEVKFYIQGRRELRYVTSALGGYFRRFPVGPFVIRPTPPKKTLAIRFPNSAARQFIRGAGGRFAGAKSSGADEFPGGAIRVRQVLWGRRTGGFTRDVISEVIEKESVLFVKDLTEAIQGATIKLK